MAMEQIAYWLVLCIGIVCTLFTLMTVRQVIARLRKRRSPERVSDRSVTPILRFNLRKRYIPEIKANAAHSLERMGPGEMTHRLREALLNHDATMRAVAEVLGHIEARTDLRGARRGSGAESKGWMRI
jgi:hypothetical protein